MAGCFTTFYRSDITVKDGGTVTDYLQPEWASLRMMRDAAPVAEISGEGGQMSSNFVLTGPTTQATRFEIASTRLWGIGFMPVGWARFMDSPASALANTLYDAHQEPLAAKFAALGNGLYGNEPDEQAEYNRIVEVMSAYNQPSPDEERILKVHAGLVEPSVTNVSEFASHCGLGERTLERVCQRYFGFGPKLLLRRQRFMRSLSAFVLQKDKPWNSVLDRTYHDQAQFTREFHHFMGMTPSEYAALESPILSAFMEERARIWGSAAQTLDKPG